MIAPQRRVKLQRRMPEYRMAQPFIGKMVKLGAPSAYGFSASTGEMEEDYGDKFSVSTGQMALDLELLMSGYSVSDGVFGLDFDAPAEGFSVSTGEFSAELIAALVNYACYVLNMDTKGVYQFNNYAFYGLGRFNNKLIGAIGNNILDLESLATQDITTNITAYFEVETDFSLAENKAMRNIYTEDDPMAITLTDEAGNIVALNITPDEFRSLPRDAVSKVFTIKAQNISGEQVTVRRLYGEIDILNIKGRR